MKRRLFLAVLLAGLSACAHGPAGRDCIAFDAGFQFCPLPPARMGQSFERQDRVMIRSPQGEQWFIGQLELDVGHLSAAGLHPSGMRLFELSWDGRDLAFQAHAPTSLPEPEWLLLILQSVFAPAAGLGEALPRGEILERDYDDHRLRRVLVGGEERLRVRYPVPCSGASIVAQAGEVLIELTRLDDADTEAGCPPAF
jgi:hypothetical protein